MAIGDKSSWLPMGGEKAWSHPNHGEQLRVEVDGCETRLIFVGKSRAAADKLADDLLAQIKKGSIKINIGGTISKIVEE
jgi:hypothetical protein